MRGGVLALALTGGLLLVFIGPHDRPITAESVGAQSLAVGARHACVGTAADDLYCWGSNGSHQLAAETATDCGFEQNFPCSRAPVLASLAPSGVAQLAAGAAFNCARTSGLLVECWGDNFCGQLGDGTSGSCDFLTFEGGLTRAEPVQVCADGDCEAPLADAVAVAAGTNHACAVISGGGLRCWGLNSSGQLGDGTTTNRSHAVDVCLHYDAGSTSCIEPLTDVLSVAAGVSHTCAVVRPQAPVVLGLPFPQPTGEVWCWGGNQDGAIGQSDNIIFRTTPQRICMDVSCSSVLDDVRSLAAGNHHTCARLADASVRCWGSNGSGQLGDGNGEFGAFSRFPVEVCSDASCAEGLDRVSDMTVGRSHTCVIATVDLIVESVADGLLPGPGVPQAMCWGDNGEGQIGDGSTNNRTTPVEVCSDAGCTGTLSDVATIRAGADHTCTLTNEGGVWCWGQHRFGQLGNGEGGGQFDRSSTPVEVLGLGPAPKPPTATPTLPIIKGPPPVTSTPTSTQVPPLPTDTPGASRPGDTNCDGELTAVDASLILQLAAGLLADLLCLEAGDVNGDGSANALDAAIILQFVAGLLDVL